MTAAAKLVQDQIHRLYSKPLETEVLTNRNLSNRKESAQGSGEGDQKAVKKPEDKYYIKDRYDPPETVTNMINDILPQKYFIEIPHEGLKLTEKDLTISFWFYVPGILLLYRHQRCEEEVHDFLAGQHRDRRHVCYFKK